MSAPEFDVLDVSDLRFPGGTSHSIAEEVAAQAAAGYRTGLVHLNGPLVRRLTPVNPLIRRRVAAGDATLHVSGEAVRAAVTVVRHPAVLQHAADQLPVVDTDRVVVVANAGPADINGYEHYDPARVDEVVEAHFGLLPVWAPIGPLVRDQVAGRVPAARLVADDWVNVIDVDAWSVTRRGWASDRPVVGRHSRPSRQKWPADPQTMRQIYPVDGSWDVRVLGGAEPVAEVLGRVPPSWTVLPFGATSPRKFLAGLDFFVYYHDPAWVEAFGRTVLEAVASGVPAVLPPHFEVLFGSAALYAEPTQVRDLVEGLRADRPRYVAHVEQAQREVRRRFGHEAHARRVGDLLGTPPVVPDRAPAGHRPPQRPRVLLISSNGAGMGHLTRLLAYARALGEEAEPHVLSMSQAVPVVGRLGLPYEYLPSARTLEMPTSWWHELYVERVVESLDRVRPEVVVFDGTWPYAGTERVRSARPRARWVWSRRGMWRPGANEDQLAKAAWFDSVLEPGDLAAPYDRGATAGADAVRVGPVTLVDRGELEPRDAARAALGLPEHGPLALVSLGAGNINDTSDDAGAVTAALRALGVGVCVTRPEIAVREAGPRGVHLVQDYPLARRYAAFDLVVSASGYNSFHEVLRLGVPCLFVPNPATSLDDQDARARYAADQGWAHRLREVSVDAATPLLADLLERGTTMVAGATAADPGNGAPAAAAHVLQLAGLSGDAVGQP